MKYLTLLFLIAVGGAGCAQTTMNSNAKPDSEATPVIAETATTPEKVAAECKICYFDFDAYKGELKKEEIEGLLLALNDEYLAISIYKGVNEKFGDPRPFVNIINAEIQHADRLKGLFEQYDLPVPENKWLSAAPSFETVTAACEAGVEAEIANKQLYDRLFKSTAREDILVVYRSLQRASEENHKPAFERCAAGNGGSGRGPGLGAGRTQ